MHDIHLINGEFETATPESVGIPSGAIADCLEAIIRSDRNIHSLHVFKNGYLVAGGSAKPFTDTSRRRVYSTMKSVIALAVLFLVQEGKLSFEDKIVDWFPGDVPEDCSELMKNLTLRNILNMSVGQEKDALSIYHAANFGEEMIPLGQRGKGFGLDFDPKGMTLEQIFFRLPMDFVPGTRFHYVNTVPELLIRLITKASGTDFIHYLKPRLFDKLHTDVFNSQETTDKGWSPAGYHRSADEEVSTYLDGSTTVTSSKDLCKFALFYLQRGSWEGEQLLDPALIDEATSLLIPTADFAAKTGQAEDNAYGYGMQIWRNSYGGYQMLGGCGQTAVIIPELELAIVWCAFDPAYHDGGTAVLVRDLIFKALRKHAIQEDPAAFARLQQLYRGWTITPPALTSDFERCNIKAGSYTLAEPVDGFTAAAFDYKEKTVSLTQGDKVTVLDYGLCGSFVRNADGPDRKIDGYSCVYENDRRAVWAACGTMDAETLLLQLQYEGEMQPMRYYFTPGADGVLKCTKKR